MEKVLTGNVTSKFGNYFNKFVWHSSIKPEKKKNPDKIHILGSQSFKMLDIEIL